MRDHCTECDEYDTSCAACIAAVIPRYRTCWQHRHLETESREAAARNANDEYRKNKARLRGGLQRNFGGRREQYLENDANLPDGSNNNNNNNNEWKLWRGRAFLY